MALALGYIGFATFCVLEFCDFESPWLLVLPFFGSGI